METASFPGLSCKSPTSLASGIMAAFSVSRLLCAGLFAALAAGASVQPSNDTLNSQEGGSELQLGLKNAPPAPASQFYAVAPLTTDAGLGQGQDSTGLQVGCLSRCLN